MNLRILTLCNSTFSPCVLKRRKELAIRLQKWLVDAFWCNLKPCNEDRNTRGTAVHGSSQQQWNSFSVLSRYTRLCRGQCQNFAEGFYSSSLKKEIKHLYFCSVQHREAKGSKAANLQRNTDLTILISFLIWCCFWTLMMCLWSETAEDCSKPKGNQTTLLLWSVFRLLTELSQEVDLFFSLQR